MELRHSPRIALGHLLPEVARYLQRLGLPPAVRATVRAALDACLARVPARDPASQMSHLHRVLAESATAAGAATEASAAPEDSAATSLAARFALTGDGRAARPPVGGDGRGRVRLSAAPPIERTSMTPLHWPNGTDGAGGTHLTAPRRDWHRSASARRATLLVLILVQTWFATGAMAQVLPYRGTPPLEMAIVALFAVLFAWVSAGFWTALTGFGLLLTGRDRYAITRGLDRLPPIDPDARTAVIMPICNESVARVFAGLRATYTSLAQTGQLAHFDFFVLSDTSAPDTRVAELDAWQALCRAVDGFGRVFYRRRRVPTKRKSGNVADFCRRWGARYRYMVVLDADSVMSGTCLTQLVQLMEADPGTGIIQTAPRAAGRGTLHARMQQFATRVYGPLFTAGLHFWQLGESHYWGHNAIIRVAPFTQFCALGRLPGKGALSGEVLSHDIVEAALMRRAGWGVWIAYDLDGSYEEMPPNLNDELKRDRRWCQGNLMNLRLSVARGLHPAHRAVFVTGVMAYASAPLWLLFLLLSTALLAQHTLVPPTYFVEPDQLFPLWPQSNPAWVAALIGTTVGLLYLPKLLGVVLLALRGRGGRGFGGVVRLLAGVLAESVFSALMAPVRMMFHTRFVLGALFGWTIQWKSPDREDAETTWAESLNIHGLHSALGLAWGVLVYWLNPAFLWWLLPVVGALAVSILVDVATSRVELGRRARALGLFVIPEESAPPAELADAQRWATEAPPVPRLIDAVVDPRLNAVVCAAGTIRERPSDNGAADRVREQLMQRALSAGPAALSAADGAALLNDPVALSRLHFRVWSSVIARRGWHVPDPPPQPRAARPRRMPLGPWDAVRPPPARQGV